MPTVKLLVMPKWQSDALCLRVLLEDLKLIVRECFGPRVEGDVAGSIIPLLYASGDAKLQVEVLFSAGGEDIDPDEGTKDRLAELLLKRLDAYSKSWGRRFASSLLPTCSAWVVPLRGTAFRELKRQS